MVWLIASPAPSARSGELSEARYNVISAFLYNFLMFTEWPAHDELDEGPYRIGILGANPFTQAAATIEQRTIEGRPILFQHFRDLTELTPTHVLFLVDGDRQTIAQVRATLGRAPVLIVGDTDRFTRDGGIIRFFDETVDASGEEKVLRVEINETASEQAGIRFRSKLMRLAHIVHHPIPPGP